MRNDLQKKLYEQEVTPPATAWNTIVASLDESHLADKFPATLYNAEQTSPVAWATIAAAIDASSVSSKLYDLEAQPPVTAWEKIKASLEPEQEKAAPVRRLFPAMFRYAAAAAIIAAVAFGGIKLLNNNKNEDALVEGKNIQVKENTTSLTNSDVATNIPSETTDASQDARDAAALEESKKMYASLDASDMQRIKRVSETHLLSAVDPMNSSSSINPGNTYKDLECSEVKSPSFNDDDSPINMANRYSMLMTPDGHIIRISKKLGPLVCCVSGEDTDDDCNNQLKKWKEKLAHSDAGTSSGNFLEILNLIQSFKENNP
jgi:hypothetical protein